MVVLVWCGNGNPSVARFGVCVLRRDREAEARDRWRCRARNVEMLRARLWWAQRWGFSGGVLEEVGGGVYALVALGKRPVGAAVLDGAITARRLIASKYMCRRAIRAHSFFKTTLGSSFDVVIQHFKETIL